MSASNRFDLTASCRELVVPPDVCRLRFSSDRTSTAEHIGYTTRGELVVVRYTAAGEIAHIELVGDDKPCQCNLPVH